MESAGALSGSVNAGRLGSIGYHCPALGACILHPPSPEGRGAAPGAGAAGAIVLVLGLLKAACPRAWLGTRPSLDSPLSWDGRKPSVRTWEQLGAPHKNRWARQNRSRATEAALMRGESPADPRGFV